MFSNLRSRLTYANIAVTLALVFAMAGGAYAAKKYIVTSVSQIKPSVVAQLRGKNGSNGKAGPAGPAGKDGSNGSNGTNGTSGTNGASGGVGPTGPQGPKGATGNSVTGPSGATGPKGVTGEPWTPNNALPSGATETGEWELASTAASVGEAKTTVISFPVRLKEAPASAQFIELGQSDPAGCKGTVGKPEAEPGNLCVFEGKLLEYKGGLHSFGINDEIETTTGSEVSTSGAQLFFVTEVTGGVSAEGSWAVTAK